MQRWRTLTVGEVLDGLSRYKPFVLTLAGIVFLAILLPGARRPQGTAETTSASGGAAGDVAANTGNDAGQITQGTDVQTDSATSTTARGAVTGTAPTGARQATGGTLSKAVQQLGDAASAPDCDKAAGRILIPSIYSPNCVPIFPKGADNGGATYQGVTKNTIKVGLYVAQENEQAAAIVSAAGVEDNTADEEDDANRNKEIEAYEAHFETYGRHVIWEKLEGSGAADDETAAKADAVRMATELKVFVSFGAPSNTYVDELAARGVMCMCTVSQPIENYMKWAPHVWSDLMASSQGYIHRAEIIGKRLWGRNAIYAGDAIYKNSKRRFGIVYYETEDGAYKAGVDFFEKELLRYGAKMSDRIDYVLDLTKAQEDARIIVARLKDKGITSVVFAGDPLMPIFLTQEATKQAYNPEWVITGSALTDTTLFARTYDQTQWQHAFGVSYLTARVAPAVTENELNVHEWHFGEALTSYPSALALGKLYTGVHLAGPKLTPKTYEAGMFSFKPTKGFITQFAVSYGTGLWPWPDYLSADDATEIWWDPTARGPDELGNEAVGMYQYMDMGKRFLPGQWPTGEGKYFVKENTTTMYDDRPAPDRVPQPPHKHFRVPPAEHGS